mgnify:CR=1 FL=1
MHILGLRSFWIPLLLVTGLSAAVCIPLSHRRSGLKELRKKEVELKHRLHRLRERNEDLRAERNALLSSLRQIERVAREQYGYRGENEFVRKIITHAPSPPEPKPPAPEKGLWNRLLRHGRYPWRIPASVFGISVFVIGALNALGASRPSENTNEEEKQDEDAD